MKRKILPLIILFLALLLTGCKKEKEKNIKTDYKLGNLSYSILEKMKKQTVQNSNIHIFSYKETTLTLEVKKDIKDNLEDFCNNYDKWSLNLENYEQVLINGIEWYKSQGEEKKWITKYNNDIYYINIYSTNNDIDLVLEISNTIEKTMRF